MHDVDAFGIGGPHGGARIVAVKQQRLHPRLPRRKGGLNDAIGQRLIGGRPPRPIAFARVIAIVAIEEENRIVHSVRVENNPTRFGHEVQQADEIQPAYPIKLRLEDNDDIIERGHVGRKHQFRESGITTSVNRKSVAKFPADSRILRESLYASGVGPPFHGKQNLHVRASSSKRVYRSTRATSLLTRCAYEWWEARYCRTRPIASQ